MRDSYVTPYSVHDIGIYKFKFAKYYGYGTNIGLHVTKEKCHVN